MKSKIIKSIVGVEFIDLNLMPEHEPDTVLELDCIDLESGEVIPREKLKDIEMQKEKLLKENMKIRENELKSKTLEELKEILDNVVNSRLEELHIEKINSKGNRHYTINLLSNLFNKYNLEKSHEERLKVLISRVNASISPADVLEKYWYDKNESIDNKVYLETTIDKFNKLYKLVNKYDVEIDIITRIYMKNYSKKEKGFEEFNSRLEDLQKEKINLIYKNHKNEEYYFDSEEYKNRSEKYKLYVQENIDRI